MPRIKQDVPEQDIRALIDAEEKVPVIIPPDPLNKWRTHVEGSVNMVTFRIPVGKMVTVPRSVAEVLVNSDYLGSKITIEQFTDPFEVRKTAAEIA